MRLDRYLAGVLLLCDSGLVQAYSCLPGPQFELDDRAVYRFAENGAPAIDVSITAVQQTRIEIVFSITEANASYLASYPFDCGFGIFGGEESELVASLYSNFYRVRELLDVNPWVFGAEDPVSHIKRVSNECTNDELTMLDTCVIRHEPGARVKCR